jgi:putative transposase
MREQIRQACFRELLTDEETDALVQTIEVPWSMYSLRKEWNREKSTVAPWRKAHSKFAYESGLTALAAALSNFSVAKRSERPPAVGFPRFKKAGGRSSCRFWACSGLSVVDERHIRLPRIGMVRSKEMTTELGSRLDRGIARILHATIAEEAGRWFISFCCQVERSDAPASSPDDVVGVDLGVSHLAVLSTGKFVKNPKPLERYARRMARLQHELARRQKGSRRRARTRSQLARLHRKVRCTRTDALHQLTSHLAATYGTIAIEDLNVKGMTASPRPRPDPMQPGRYLSNNKRAKAGLNRSILDTAPSEFRRQLAYKVAWRGGKLVVAGRFYPSSKTCSSCGSVKAKLSLSTRTYRCACGLELDRDLNAARNLEALARGVAAGRVETENGRGGEHGSKAEPSPTKRQDGSRQRHKTVLVDHDQSDPLPELRGP